MPQDSRTEPRPQAAGRFDSTHWTVVLAAAQTQSSEAQKALAALCDVYWPPLYCYLRRKGFGPHDAEDLTQQFFEQRVVTKLVLKGIDPSLGKFRTWLLTSLQNFLHNERARQNAQKRGGQAVHLSIHAQDGEGRYLAEPACNGEPEQYYDRIWGMRLLEQALGRLHNSFEEKGELSLYRELARFLPGAEQPPYDETAAKLGMTEAALKMRVSRLRQDLGRLLTAEVKRTVSSPAEAKDELRYLLTVLGA